MSWQSWDNHIILLIILGLWKNEQGNYHDKFYKTYKTYNPTKIVSREKDCIEVRTQFLLASTYVGMSVKRKKYYVLRSNIKQNT